MDKINKKNGKLLLLFAGVLMFQCCCCIFPLHFSSGTSKPDVDPSLPAAQLEGKFICQAEQGDTMTGVTGDHQAYISQDAGKTWKPAGAGKPALAPACLSYVEPLKSGQ